MIDAMVHFPTIYSRPPGDAGESRYYYDVVLRILDDADRGCVVLLDPAGAIEREIDHAIQTWPPRHKKQVQMLRTRLRKRNRLVKVAPGALPASCQRQGCNAAAGIAVSSRSDMPWVILPESCAAGAACLAAERRILHVSEYMTSEFIERARKLEVRHVSAGTPVEDFDAEICRSLFRYTKHVKIFDRWIGRRALDAVIRGDDRPNRFLTSLRWLFDRFAEWSQPRTGRLFEVTTGLWVDSGQSHAAAVHVARQLIEYARELTARHGPDGPVFQFQVKEEGPGRALPHDRYLITDQIALNISGGFDFLSGDGTRRCIREMTISQERNPGAIELQFRALPALG